MPVDSADTMRVKNVVEIALSRTVYEINVFLLAVYAGIQDDRPKMAEELFLGKVASRLQKPCGSKILSKSLYLAPFYTEIQDGRQKWRENDFWDNWPEDSADTMRIKNFIKIALAHSVSEIKKFYTEIQDGREKWQENDFWGKSPVDSTDNLRV